MEGIKYRHKTPVIVECNAYFASTGTNQGGYVVDQVPRERRNTHSRLLESGRDRVTQSTTRIRPRQRL